jgi:hypothetical protein
MAFTQHGATKYSFAFKTATETTAVAAAAIEAATGIAPQELEISGEPEFVAEAEGPDGTVEAVAVAAVKRAFTLSGFLTNKETFDEEGTTFEHDGKTFIVMNRQIMKAAKGFQKAQMTGMSWDGVEAEEPPST